MLSQKDEKRMLHLLKLHIFFFFKIFSRTKRVNRSLVHPFLQCRKPGSLRELLSSESFSDAISPHLLGGSPVPCTSPEIMAHFASVSLWHRLSLSPSLPRCVLGAAYNELRF